MNPMGSGLGQVIPVLYVLMLAVKEILILVLLIQGIRYLSFMLKYRKSLKKVIEKDEIIREETYFEVDKEDFNEESSEEDGFEE